MFTAVKTFADWLESELKRRNWSRAELSRKSGIGQSTLSMIYSGKRNVGPEACEAIAHALNLPPETVYRAAGLLPPLPTLRQAVDEILDYKLAELTPEQREEVLQFVEFIRARDKRQTSQNTLNRDGANHPKVFKPTV